MSAAKHTPGPWRVEKGQLRAEEFVVLADLHPWSEDTLAVRAEAEANARLIAAAPELLEALRAMRDSIPSGSSLNAKQAGALDKACAAIAKATGEAA